MELEELNLKIADLIATIGFSSSKFADYIGVSRPVISHITAGRNKPSLDIIQRIVKKFPELGINWTFDGERIPEEVLKKIAKRLDDEERKDELARLRESRIQNDPNTHPELFDSQAVAQSINLGGTSKRITKIVVFYEDNSFSEFSPS
ncbi:helix-turn-helix transcriptional regulator [Jiulongibacter sediminis]|uniref:helix-turn-helix transcriptional regulator n=1 Tax=Jiulongibacter sediminis TaxID=1605367 RepID=UPI0006DCCE1B|nr:helix-turn-helix transcriptional regulator [Jiulongibacter sediminis]